MEHICPNCKRQISIQKYKLYTCMCGARLLAIQIHKEITIQDVTAEYTDFKNELMEV